MHLAAGVIFFVVLIIRSCLGKVSLPFGESRESLITVFSTADENKNYRLPNDTKPTHYEIKISTAVHIGEPTFYGEVKIYFHAEISTKQIVVHARQLTDVVGGVIDEGRYYQLSHSYDNEMEFLTFIAGSNKTFVGGKNYILQIRYSGQLRKDLKGFYMSSYINDANEPIYLASTHLESTNARLAFPCYDEPALRATFTITIEHDPSYFALSNMPADIFKSRNGVTVFETTPSMSTYLVAFVVSKFVGSSISSNNITQQTFSRRGTEEQHDFSSTIGIQILDRFAEYFQVPYTLPKMDLVAIPEFAQGAMENWGLVIFPERNLLCVPGTTALKQYRIAYFIGHEYCHQWLGNLVTMKWWSYLWLKEGLATIFAYEVVDKLYPEWDMMEIFQVNDYQGSLQSESTDEYQRPLTFHVDTPEEISEIYDYISYSKAASVFYMWQQALGEDVFKQGLHFYLVLNKFSATEERDLYNAIQIAVNNENPSLSASIEEMMSSWTQQDGYPLLTVDRNYNDGIFTVTQSYFCSNISRSDGRSWHIPFNFAVESKPNFQHTEAQYYLNKKTRMVVIPSHTQELKNSDWLILNKQSTGYYRINYDDRNWNLLIDGINRNPHKIHPRNRAQLMNDANHLRTSQRLKHSVVLNLMTYLPSEDQYAPWATAKSIITSLDRYLHTDAHYNDFQYYVSHLVRNAYQKFGVNEKHGEKHSRKLTRLVVIEIACQAGISRCLRDTNNKLKALINNETAIEPNLRSVIFCNGLRQSGDYEFEFVFNKLRTSKDQDERTMLISALGCKQSPQHIRKFIQISLSSAKGGNLQVQEKLTILKAAYSKGGIGLLETVKFLTKNYLQYADLDYKLMDINQLESDVLQMSKLVVSNEQKELLLQLVRKINMHAKITTLLEEKVKKNVAANFSWLRQSRGPLMNWFSSFRTLGGQFRNCSGNATVKFKQIV